MAPKIEYFRLSVGDSEMVLIEELIGNPSDVYCVRTDIENMWPPTAEEKTDSLQVTYSKTKLIELLKDEGIEDRTIKAHPAYILFKKL